MKPYNRKQLYAMREKNIHFFRYISLKNCIFPICIEQTSGFEKWIYEDFPSGTVSQDGL